MVPIASLLLSELAATVSGRVTKTRTPEPITVMDDRLQIDAYQGAYSPNGPTIPLLIFNLFELSSMIRPGDVVVDLACGPGDLLIELAELFPETKFIGVDLAPEMLKRVHETAEKRKLSNIETRCEDISKLQTFDRSTIDVVISIQALHHLPDNDAFAATLKRLSEILKADGGLYLFDFGLLKSERTRRLIVNDAAREVSKITAKDYLDSLNAAFPVEDVLAIAKTYLPTPFRFKKSRFIDFFYLLQKTRANVAADPLVVEKIKRKEDRLRLDRRLELASLRYLSTSRLFN